VFGLTPSKREPASDIETAEVDSLKVLDPEWPIREADIAEAPLTYRDLRAHALICFLRTT
jgi:hypothetical protein